MNEGKPTEGHMEALEGFLAYRRLGLLKDTDRQTDRKQHRCQMNSTHSNAAW